MEPQHLIWIVIAIVGFFLKKKGKKKREEQQKRQQEILKKRREEARNQHQPTQSKPKSSTNNSGQPKSDLELMLEEIINQQKAKDQGQPQAPVQEAQGDYQSKARTKELKEQKAVVKKQERQLTNKEYREKHIAQSKRQHEIDKQKSIAQDNNHNYESLENAKTLEVPADYYNKPSYKATHDKKFHVKEEIKKKRKKRGFRFKMRDAIIYQTIMEKKY